MAYHHFCVTLSSLSLSLAFLLHFSPTIFTMAYDLFEDGTRQFKPHPRHHRYHSSFSTNRPYYNQEDTQVAYLPILIISIVISLFLIVNCYKKESSPNIPDLTETSRLSTFLSRACYNNKVTGHHSFLLSKVKTTPTTSSSPLTATLPLPLPLSSQQTSLIPLINRTNSLPLTTTVEKNLNYHQSDSLRDSNINLVKCNDDEYLKQLLVSPSAHSQGKQLVLQSVDNDYYDDDYRYFQPQQQQRYYHENENTTTNHHHYYHQLYQYQQCPASDHHHTNCLSSSSLSSSSSSPLSSSPPSSLTATSSKPITSVTSSPIVSLLSSACSTPPQPILPPVTVNQLPSPQKKTDYLDLSANTTENEYHKHYSTSEFYINFCNNNYSNYSDTSCEQYNPTTTLPQTSTIPSTITITKSNVICFSDNNLKSLNTDNQTVVIDDDDDDYDNLLINNNQANQKNNMMKITRNPVCIGYKINERLINCVDESFFENDPNHSSGPSSSSSSLSLSTTAAATTTTTQLSSSSPSSSSFSYNSSSTNNIFSKQNDHLRPRITYFDSIVVYRSDSGDISDFTSSFVS